MKRAYSAIGLVLALSGCFSNPDDDGFSLWPSSILPVPQFDEGLIDDGVDISSARMPRPDLPPGRNFSTPPIAPSLAPGVSANNPRILSTNTPVSGPYAPVDPNVSPPGYPPPYPEPQYNPVTVSGGSGAQCLAVDVLAHDGAFIRAGTAGYVTSEGGRDMFVVNGVGHDISGINYSIANCASL